MTLNSPFLCCPTTEGQVTSLNPNFYYSNIVSLSEFFSGFLMNILLEVEMLRFGPSHIFVVILFIFPMGQASNISTQISTMVLQNLSLRFVNSLDLILLPSLSQQNFESMGMSSALQCQDQWLLFVPLWAYVYTSSNKLVCTSLRGWQSLFSLSSCLGWSLAFLKRVQMLYSAICSANLIFLCLKNLFFILARMESVRGVMRYVSKCAQDLSTKKSTVNTCTSSSSQPLKPCTTAGQGQLFLHLPITMSPGSQKRGQSTCPYTFIAQSIIMLIIILLGEGFLVGQ